MSDVPTSGPPRVPVTAEFLAECGRKQAAYTESRRRHRMAWNKGDEDEALDPPTSSAAPPRSRRSRGRIIDPRQFKLEL